MGINIKKIHTPQKEKKATGQYSWWTYMQKSAKKKNFSKPNSKTH